MLSAADKAQIAVHAKRLVDGQYTQERFAYQLRSARRFGWYAHADEEEIIAYAASNGVDAAVLTGKL